MTQYVRYVVSALLELISTLLLVRAILSWIPPVRGTMVDRILTTVTDPFLMPFRMLFDRLGLNNFFIDLSFLATYITIQLLAALIY